MAIRKPRLDLVGLDGNVLSILARAFLTARTAGWSLEKIEKFKGKATSGDYNNLLATCMEYFDVR